MLRSETYSFPCQYAAYRVELRLSWRCLLWAPGGLLCQGTSAFSAHPSATGSSQFLVPKARCLGSGHALLLLDPPDPSIT